MTEIAVIIPIHARSAKHWVWLREALRSVWEQDFKDYEIIVVDDASPIDPPELNSSVRMFRQDRRRGPGAARNLAARAATSPWLLPLDSDDELIPGALAAFYKNRCDSEVVYGDIEWMGERGGYQRMHEYDPMLLRKLEGPLPVTALHLRKAWQAVGGWDEHLSGLEDLEYWIKLAEIGICPRRAEFLSIRYRRRIDSRSRALELNKARHKEVTDEIKSKHPTFFGGVTMAECASCPGGVPLNTVNALTANVPEGWVEMKYLGMMQGGFFTPNSQTTGNRYRIDGRGAYFYVDPLDVDWLLSLRPRGEPDYERINRVITPSGSTAQTLSFESLPELPELPKVTEMSVRRAREAIAEVVDIRDLRVLMASENASETRRKTVIDAIEKQIRRVEDDDLD